MECDATMNVFLMQPQFNNQLCEPAQCIVTHKVRLMAPVPAIDKKEKGISEQAT